MAFRSLDQILADAISDLGIDLEKMGQPKPARVWEGDVKHSRLALVVRNENDAGTIADALHSGRCPRATGTRRHLTLVWDRDAHDASTSKNAKAKATITPPPSAANKIV